MAANEKNQVQNPPSGTRQLRGLLKPDKGLPRNWDYRKALEASLIEKFGES